MLKRSPAPLRFGAYDKRSVLLKGGRLYWSKGQSCSEKTALGYVDFTSLECEVTAEAGSGSRFTVSPLGGKWLAGAGQFTGSSAGRAFAFEAAPWSCEHSRDVWMTAIRAHVAYAQAVGRPAAAERSEEEWLDPITPRAGGGEGVPAAGARHSCEATPEEISVAAWEDLQRVALLSPAVEKGPSQLVDEAPEVTEGHGNPFPAPVTGPSPRSSTQRRRSLSEHFDDDSDGEQAEQKPHGTTKSAEGTPKSAVAQPTPPRLRKSLSEYFDDDSD